MKNNRIRIGALLAVLLFSCSLWSCGQKGNLVLLDTEKVAKKKPTKQPTKQP